MLKIFFGDNPGDNYIFNPDVFFNNTYEDEWITSETSRKIDQRYRRIRGKRSMHNRQSISWPDSTGTPLRRSKNSDIDAK